MCAVFLTYLRVVHYEFITLDDPDYVTDNIHVQAGIVPASVAWAFGNSFPVKG